MIEKLPREVLADVINRTKTADVKGEMAQALADAIVAGLERRGYLIAKEADVLDPPDEHIETLKDIRQIIRKSVKDEDTPARDLASLTRRLQDISREIAGLEERQRADNKSKGTTNGAVTNSSRAAQSGPLNI